MVILLSVVLDSDVLCCTAVKNNIMLVELHFHVCDLVLVKTASRSVRVLQAGALKGVFLRRISFSCQSHVLLGLHSALQIRH